MATDHIRYDVLAQEALRQMVRKVLVDVSKGGLKGDHHFNITFDTRAPGVRIPPRLREQYPQEMTIVMQYQFWDLKVGTDSFEVGLSFGGVPEQLTVPFTAITTFVDPSVGFQLQFQILPDEAVEPAPAPEPEVKATKLAGKPQRPPRPTPARVPATSVPPVASTPAAPSPATPELPPDKPGAEVVRLDRFRKK
jgi:hypothetical protein